MDAPSLPKFRLSVLGRFELSGSDGPVDLPNKKLAGLLAYLASTAPTPQHREKLAMLLWGSHFEAQARQNLRQALFRLRRVLGQDVLLSDGEEVSLTPDDIACDATELKVLVGQGTRASLTEAVGLYKSRLSGRYRHFLSKLGASGLTASACAWRAWHSMPWSSSATWSCRRAPASKVLRPPIGRSRSTTCARTRSLAIRALAAAGRRADALKRKRRRGRDARVLTDTGRPPHGNLDAVWLTDVGWEEVRGARRSALYSVPVGR
jgi:hypothetical protein